MRKEERYELIERYLEGELSDRERREVEFRMENDPDFRAEVDLQRDMQTHLGDPQELRLRAALEDVRQKARPEPDRSPFFLRLLGVFLIGGLIAFLLWYFRPFTSRSSPDSATPQNREQDAGPESPNQPAVPEDKIQENVPQSRPLPPSEPIALADPAKFIPNPALEQLLRDQLRSQGLNVELVNPDTATVLILQPDKTVRMPVSIRMSGGDLTASQPFKLFIYSNRPADWEKKSAVFSRDLSWMAVDETTQEARFQQKLSLSPGLYYLVIGMQRSPDAADGYRTVGIGKFRVRP